MHWRLKAGVMGACAAAPGGPRLYRALQRRFGNLRPDPWGRLPHLLEVARWLRDDGRDVAGKTLLEVGTGHVPLLPVGLCLLGAAQVLTLDLHRRLDLGVTGATLAALVAQRAAIEPRLAEVAADAALLARRYDLLAEAARDPGPGLAALGVVYRAPADAAATGLPAGSVDLHLSVNVLEHVAPGAIAAIFAEARRLLAPGGRALHVVDLSDHFQHHDPGIGKLHFLRYSERRWRLWAGNALAYTNRLRRDDLAALWRGQGWSLVREEVAVDELALSEARAGALPLHPSFAGRDPRDLCAVRQVALLSPVSPPATSGPPARTRS